MVADLARRDHGRHLGPMALILAADWPGWALATFLWIVRLAHDRFRARDRGLAGHDRQNPPDGEASWFFLSLTREPAVASNRPAVSQWQYLRRPPIVLQRNRNFRRYLQAQIVFSLSGMATGILAVCAAQTWGLSDAGAGGFTIAMQIGRENTLPGVAGALAPLIGVVSLALLHFWVRDPRRDAEAAAV